MLAKPSLTLKRRLKAPPSNVFNAWADPEKLALWFGPAHTVQDTCARRWTCARAGGSGCGSAPTTGKPMKSAAPTRRWWRTKVWSSPGPGTHDARARVARHRRRWADGDGTLLTLHHEQFFDEQARDGHQRGWTGTLEKLDRYLS